ncbi:type IV toxin-antitoxin system AbiEi family antitoxin domain-containing protein [Bdellovibrionota bacterium FG-1]
MTLQITETTVFDVGCKIQCDTISSLCHIVFMAKRPVFPQKLQNRLFTWAEAKQLGVSWNEIQRQLKTGGLERMSRGVYRAPAEDINDEEQFRIATLRLGGDSAVCLLSALAFYGLTDNIPRAVWLLVPVEKHTRFAGARLFRKREPRFNVGVVREKGYSITSVERTLAECLIERKRIGTNVAVEALRTAIAQKKTTLSNVLDMANQLSAADKIRPYIEAMA